MLDIRKIRENPEMYRNVMENRGEGVDPKDIDTVIELDKKRRNYLVEVEALKAERNKVSAEIPKLKKEGKDVSGILKEMKSIGDKIKDLDNDLRETKEKIDFIMLRLPNVPNKIVPEGETDEDNVEVKKWGEIKNFDFTPKAHWDIGKDLDIIDAERASKITGSRFIILKRMGAKLERAIINYYLDMHDDNGYDELLPPFMVNRTSMTGTGQLPKFEDDAFNIRENDYFLIPTAEVPVTNMYANEILDGEDLPLKYAAYSACFRAEAGSAGRDTRGLIRQHQFNKVELVKFVKPEESYKELDSLVEDAEKVLQGLKLPYRKVLICKGDLGFSAALKYDLEVWMPSYERYVEISSISNFEDFQARRINIKYREDRNSKAEFVHTLNGSGVAIGRTVAAILENFQNEDGTVTIPEVLRPYMRNETLIK